MNTKTFAAEYKRNERGWLEFPSDVSLRRSLFVPASMKHPAKANMHLIQEIVKYVSEPGDTVLDPFGGSGTLIVSAGIGRHVKMVELNLDYCALIGENRARFLTTPLGQANPEMRIELYPGPCQDVLKGMDQVDAIVTSPPYAKMMHAGIGSKLAADYETDYANYVQKEQVKPNGQPYNLGQMDNFLFTQEMDTIYKYCYQVLRPGGYFTLIIKDRIRSRKRVELGMQSVQKMLKAGFRLASWERWAPPGTQFVQLHKKRGDVMVEDEHIIFMRKGL